MRMRFKDPSFNLSQGLIRSIKLIYSIRSGLPSERKNLSPFTKDFRGGGQTDEPIGNFLSPCFCGALSNESKNSLANH